jgi:hypothetical protein
MKTMRSVSEDRKLSAEEQEPGGEKKPYESPRLTEYGGIARLTQSGAGSGTDGGADPTMMMVCL